MAMDYEAVIRDYNNGTLDHEKVILVMDNDGGYWRYVDDDATEEEIEEYESALDETYGRPEGYDDIVDVLNAAGVNAEWC